MSIIDRIVAPFAESFARQVAAELREQLAPLRDELIETVNAPLDRVEAITAQIRQASGISIDLPPWRRPG